MEEGRRRVEANADGDFSEFVIAAGKDEKRERKLDEGH